MLTALALLAATPAVVEPRSTPPLAAPAPAAATPLVALPPLPPVDPARLALAQVSANVWFRDGSMARMVDEVFSLKPGGYPSSMLDLTLRQLVGMAGMPLPASKSDGGNLTLRQMIAKNDPYFDQRMAAIHDALLLEVVRLSPRFEPQLRDGLAQSMARRFTAAQLADLNRFLTTPSGQAFADSSYLMWLDPAVMRSVLGTIPGLVGEVPGVMARVRAANDRFPAPVWAKPTPPATKRPAPKKPVSRRKT